MSSPTSPSGNRPGRNAGSNRGGSRSNGSYRGGARRPVRRLSRDDEPSVRTAEEDGEQDGERQIELEGVVSAVLAGTMFRVRLANGRELLAHISGKMRKRFIRLVVGDRVKIEMSPYDMTKARITFRIG